MTKETVKRLSLDVAAITLGSFAVALGINLFLLPCKLSTGGVGGVGTILYHLFSVPLSLSVLLLNVALFILGYRTLKKSSLLKTALGIGLLSLFLELTSFVRGYGEDILISSVFGGILVGFGVGLTVLRDASTGGSDFAALMLKRLFPHIGISTFLMIIDSAVIIASGIAFSDYTIMFYSVISLYISSKVTDFILVRGGFAKSVLIISRHSERIAEKILSDVNRGVTGIYSKGLYRQDDRMMLMCVVRNKEIPSLMALVKSIDREAFTVISDVREVRGEGFSEL